MMRVLKPTGSIWVNLGDRYSQRVATRRSSHQDGLFPDRPDLRKDWKRDRAAGYARMPYENVIDVDSGRYVPEKSLMGLPWRYALRCIDELGLILRAEVIWSKPNGLPESVKDRVRRSHEQWFHFTLQPCYYSTVDEIRQPHKRVWTPGKTGGHTYKAMKAPGEKDSNLASSSPNAQGSLPGSVWEIATQPLKVPVELGVDHFAAFPMEWPRRLIRAWCPPDGVVVDPFGGTGTTALVAAMYGRIGISVDASADYCRLAQWRAADPKQRARAAGRKAPATRRPRPVPGQAALFDMEVS